MSWEIEWQFINNKSETRTPICWESVSISMNVRRDWLLSLLSFRFCRFFPTSNIYILSLLSFRFTRFSAPPRVWEKTKRGFLFWNINPFLMIWNYANCSRVLRITRAIIMNDYWKTDHHKRIISQPWLSLDKHAAGWLCKNVELKTVVCWKTDHHKRIISQP